MAMQAVLAANSAQMEKVLERTLQATLHHAGPSVVGTPAPEPDVMKEGPYPPTVEFVEPPKSEPDVPELDEFGQKKKKK
jgi:hypothetical protein